MNKSRINSINKKLEKLDNVHIESPIFCDMEGDKFIIPRDFLERLGFSTKELPSPVSNHDILNRGSEDINKDFCLVPKGHESIEKLEAEPTMVSDKEAYIYIKGAAGRMIIV